MNKVHLIGGGGVGMSALGLYLLNQGISVSASDQEETPYLKKLQKAGATVMVGHKEENVPVDAKVYYSSAIREDNPEIIFCRKNNIPCQSRHSLLAEISQNSFTLAVAGTHGKTTSTAWLGFLLEEFGFDPTVIVGGTFPPWGGNFRMGRGKFQGKPLLVLEADESDGSFLSLHCGMALLTNTDWDHPDRFQDPGEVEKEYLLFLQKAQSQGAVLIPSVESLPFFEKHGLSYSPAIQQFCIKKIQDKPSLIYQGKSVEIGLPGLHNLYNASLVLSAMSYFVNISEAIGKLPLFTGVERRLQKLGEFQMNGYPVTIISDYAHHPTELKASLWALKEMYPQVIVLWEAHRYSRLSKFFGDFQKVLKEEICYLLPLYSASENLQEYPQMAQKIETLKKDFSGDLSHFNPKDLRKFLEKKIENSCALLFAGAGKSHAYAQSFVSFMNER